MSENRTGRPTAAMQAQLTEELQQRWGQFIDQRIAAKMAEAVATVAESIGEVIRKERERTHDMIKGAIKVARLEISVEILEARSATLESVSARLDRHFDALLRTVSDGLTVKDDAGALLRRLSAPTTTRQ